MYQRIFLTAFRLTDVDKISHLRMLLSTAGRGEEDICSDKLVMLQILEMVIEEDRDENKSTDEGDDIQGHCRF